MFKKVVLGIAVCYGVCGINAMDEVNAMWPNEGMRCQAYAASSLCACRVLSIDGTKQVLKWLDVGGRAVDADGNIQLPYGPLCELFTTHWDNFTDNVKCLNGEYQGYFKKLIRLLSDVFQASWIAERDREIALSFIKDMNTRGVDYICGLKHDDKRVSAIAYILHLSVINKIMESISQGRGGWSDLTPEDEIEFSDYVRSAHQ